MSFISELAAGIGQQTGTQDPHDAVEGRFGKYTDTAANMAENEKVLKMPSGPDKSPFGAMRSATGGR